MKISKNHGLNPTIPLCQYCGKQKNEIILTGAQGEKWAKKNGFSDGQMPMYVAVENDIEPCDECKKIGVAVVELLSEVDRVPTGRRWLIKEEAVNKLLADSQVKSEVLQKRIMLIDTETAQTMGL